MKVKIFKWANALDYCRQNITKQKAFQDFKNQLEFCDWQIPSDILKSFRTADIVTCDGKPFNRIIFNVGGNKYRMICGYKFGRKNVVLYIRFIGTHKEYDKIDICKVNMF